MSLIYFHATVRPIAIPAALKMSGAKPGELLAKVCALRIRCRDDLGEQHRDELVQVLVHQLALLLRQRARDPPHQRGVLLRVLTRSLPPRLASGITVQQPYRRDHTRPEALR